MEVIICWQDYIANPSTMDMAYNVLIDHALAESDRRYAFTFNVFINLLIAVLFLCKTIGETGTSIRR
jgi:hypothetical protein